MIRSRHPAVFEPLDQAADAVIRESKRGGIHLKVQICAALSDGLAQISNVSSIMVSDLAEVRYGPEVCEPVWRAREAARVAAQMYGEAESSLAHLLNTSLGDLAMSGHQVPRSTEFNGGS